MSDHVHGLADALFGPEPDDEPFHLLGKLWARLGTGCGSELHIRVGWLAGGEFVQLVDFIPGTGKYETRVMLETRLLDRLISELGALRRHSAGSSRRLG